MIRDGEGIIVVVVKTPINFDSAAVGTLLPEVQEAIDRLLEKWGEGDSFEYWMEKYTESKERFSRLVSTSPENVAGVPNVSTAAGMVASALPLGPSSNVVVSSLEFPSNAYAWLRARSRGVEVRVAEQVGNTVPLEEFERLVDEETAVVAVGHVLFSTGHRYDLAELVEVARRSGAFLFVDAYQSVGAVKVDVKRDGVDFLATGSSKWLLGPPGAGFLYVRREVADKLHAVLPGWMSSRDHLDFSFRDFMEREGATKFETGTPNFIGYAGVSEAMRKTLDFGIEKVENRILSLTQWLIEELERMRFEVITPADRRRRAGIVVFQPNKNPCEVVEDLREKGMIASVRGDGVRVSIHYVNKEEEIEYLIRSLKEICG